MKRTIATLVCVGTLAACRPPVLAHDTGTVRVHVTGDTRNVVIQTRDPSGWVEACRGTCDQRLTAGYYRVSGNNITASKRFKLEGPDDVELAVKSGNAAAHAVAVTLIPLGGASIAVGLNLLLMGALTYSCPDCVAGYANTSMLNAGWTAIGVGAVVMLTGMFMVPWTRTTVIAPTLTDDTMSPRLRDAEQEEAHRSPAPTTVGIPLVHVTF